MPTKITMETTKRGTYFSGFSFVSVVDSKVSKTRYRSYSYVKMLFERYKSFPRCKYVEVRALFRSHPFGPIESDILLAWMYRSEKGGDSCGKTESECYW